MTHLGSQESQARPCCQGQAPEMRDGTPQPSHTLTSTHVPLTPSVKKLRSIRRLGTRFGRRLGVEDQG